MSLLSKFICVYRTGKDDSDDERRLPVTITAVWGLVKPFKWFYLQILKVVTKIKKFIIFMLLTII